MLGSSIDPYPQEVAPQETDSGSCAWDDFGFPVLSCLSEKEALVVDNRLVAGTVRRKRWS